MGCHTHSRFFDWLSHGKEQTMKKAIRIVSEESPCTNCPYKEVIPCCCCIEFIAWKRKLLRMKGVNNETNH